MNDQFIDEVMDIVDGLVLGSRTIREAREAIRAKLREVVREPVDKEESNHSGEATGKIYELRTMQDVLNLTPEEFKRMLPDLATWYEITRESSILLDITVNELNAVMVWTDDGSLDVTGVEVNLGEYGSFDLLKIAHNIGAK